MDSMSYYILFKALINNLGIMSYLSRGNKKNITQKN